MTALSDYQRLEAAGVWRANPRAQRRDVVVSLGKATLVLTDPNDTALAHWSLAAVERRNPGESPAVFAPGADATEELELSDAEMIAAIERVRRAVAKARPAPGRLRTRVALAAAVLIVAGGALTIPDALIRQAARVAPPAARAEIGAQLVDHVERVAGAPCSSPAGDRALRRLETRLLGPEGGRIVVLGDGLATAAHVPGGTILLSHELLENYETPEVAAGYILNERVEALSSDPLLRLLDWSGDGRGVHPSHDRRGAGREAAGLRRIPACHRKRGRAGRRAPCRLRRGAGARDALCAGAGGGRARTRRRWPPPIRCRPSSP